MTALVLAALAAAWLSAAPASGVPGQADPASLLPAEGELQTWRPNGTIQRFQGEDLFTYIDGGAEIYNEYGFRRVAVRDYAGPTGKTLTLEIYEMRDAGAAFGITSFKVSGKGRPAGMGTDSQLDDYYLNFWKGPYHVTVTGLDDAPETIAGLLEVARAADRKIKAAGERPVLVSRLPREGLRSEAVRYLRGWLGIFNHKGYVRIDVYRFREAVIGEYKDGRSVCLFGYAAADEARQAFGRLREALKTGSGYRNPAFEADGGFRIETAAGRFLHLRLKGELLVLVDSESGAPPAALLQKIK
jgi:hypothetical protein